MFVARMVEESVRGYGWLRWFWALQKNKNLKIFLSKQLDEF